MPCRPLTGGERRAAVTVGGRRSGHIVWTVELRVLWRAPKRRSQRDAGHDLFAVGGDAGPMWGKQRAPRPTKVTPQPPLRSLRWWFSGGTQLRCRWIPCPCDPVGN